MQVKTLIDLERDDYILSSAVDDNTAWLFDPDEAHRELEEIQAIEYELSQEEK